jgi:ABC-type branched-subunit amino acid transport system substrate-binding protein
MHQSGIPADDRMVNGNELGTTYSIEQSWVPWPNTHEQETQMVIAKRRPLIATAISALLLALVSACASSSSSSAGGKATTLQVAVDCDLSGAVASTNVPIVHALQSYVENYNKTAGSGTKINLILNDDVNLDPAIDTNYITKFVQQQNGHMLVDCSSTGLQANIPYLAAHQVVAMSTGSVATWFTGSNGKWIFGIPPLYEDTAPAILAFLKKEAPSGGPLSQAYLGTATGLPIAEAITSGAPKYGFKALSPLSVSTEGIDFAAEANVIAKPKPKALVTALLSNQLDPIAQSLGASGWKAPWVGLYGTSDADLKAGAAANYTALRFWATPGEAAQDPDMAAALKIIDREGIASASDQQAAFFMEGWLAGAALQHALEGCAKSCTASALRSSFEHLNFNMGGIAGQAKTSPSKHWIFSSGRFYTWNSAKNAPEPVSGYITF